MFINSKLYFIELIVFYYHAVLIARSKAIEIFSSKAIKLKRSASVKNVSLTGKAVVGYCRGHKTITLLFKFEGYQ